MSETALPRVLVVGLDGGIARTILMGDHRLDVRASDSLPNAMQVLSRVRPNVVVVAFRDPPSGAAADVRRVDECAGVPILLISRPVEQARVTEFLKAGVGGYLFASDAVRLPDAVWELFRGGVPMSDAVSRLVLGRARRSSAKMAAVISMAPVARGLLTSRQREILTLLAAGHSYEDIGVALTLSVNTIRTHVRTLYERLGASTKVEAVVAAIDLGLIPRNTLR